MTTRYIDTKEGLLDVKQGDTFFWKGDEYKAISDAENLKDRMVFILANRRENQSVAYHCADVLEFL